VKRVAGLLALFRMAASLLTVAGAVALMPVAHAQPAPILTDPDADEQNPAASDGYLMWAQNKNTFVRPEGEARIRLDPRGTLSFGGAIDGTTAVFAQSVDGQDDLFLFDVLTETRSDPPQGVNTPAFEAQPSISGDWLLFSRANGRRFKVILFDLTTSERRVLADLEYGTHFVTSDQVNGDWATWEACRYRPSDDTYSNCQVFRYQISTSTGTMIPNPGKQQFGAGITSDGTAYVVRAGSAAEYRCGKNVRIVRIELDGSSHVIANLPEGRDSFNTFAFDESDGSTSLYFDRYRCPGSNYNVYAIDNADTA
jgi:hypothetical protein